MRGNGLTADSYTAVSLVDRNHAGDALLVLREVGVAAYVVLADDGRVQVFADRDAVPEARQALQDLSTEPVVTDESTDDAWTQIVAGYDQSAPEPPAAWTLPPRISLDPEPPPAPPQSRSAPTDDLNTEASWEEEGHFVPPVPPPVLPPRDLVSRLAWGGLVGGPLLVLVAVVIGLGLPTEVLMLCLLGFVAGLVTLIVRMRDRGDDAGDGAVL
ncbi:MAG TPA: hypothetical protein VFJ14_12325 [Nocardioidaceae bacterium]|nr:hypothetical protein [Nocardioidaceae bacterium]